MTLEEIKTMANNSQLKFTKKIKSILTAEAAQYGIEIPNCSCRNKWSDLLLQLYAIKRNEVKKYKYLGVATTVWKGRSYNDYTNNYDINTLRINNPKLFKQLYKLV